MADALCELPRCGRPAGTAYACPDHGKRLAADLERAAELIGELVTTVTRQAVTGQGSGRNGAEVRLPFDADASFAGDVITNTISTWARLVSEERGTSIPYVLPGVVSLPAEGPSCRGARIHDPDLDETFVRTLCTHDVCRERDEARRLDVEAPPAHPLAAVLAFLHGQVEWLRHQRFASEAFDELTHAVQLLRSAIDRKADRVYLGRCWEQLADGECSEDLYAVAGRATVTCRACEAVWDVAERRRWLLAAVEDVLAPAVTIARALSALGEDVKLGSISGWAAKGQLGKHPPLPGSRVPLFRVGDVLDLVARTVRRRSASALATLT